MSAIEIRPHQNGTAVCTLDNRRKPTGVYVIPKSYDEVRETIMAFGKVEPANDHRTVRVFAVVNRKNRLPVLAFTMCIPSPEDPPARRGLRLIARRLEEIYLQNPGAVPFIHSVEQIPEIVEKIFAVVEIPLGLA